MMNRAIQAQFAPGSTFKPIVTRWRVWKPARIDELRRVHCAGGATFYGHFFKLRRRSTARSNLHGAIVHSCDTYFYHRGQSSWASTRIAEYAELAGIGKKTGIDLPGEAEGLMPSSQWKLRTQREKWYAGETISVAIGQGAVTVTPIQLASAIGGMATGGVWYQAAPGEDGAPPSRPRRANLESGEHRHSRFRDVRSRERRRHRRVGAIPGLEICGKTGHARSASRMIWRNPARRWRLARRTTAGSSDSRRARIPRSS